MARAADFDFGYNLPDARAAAGPSGSVADELTDCMGTLVCPKCGRFHGYCSEINAQLTGTTEGPQLRNGENDEMIQRGNESKGQRRGGRTNQGVPFLTVDKLSSDHSPATILAARLQDDNFKPNGPQVVVVKILLRSNTFLWTLRSNNPNLDALVDAFGPDESTWENRKISMYIEEDNFDGKKWIRCEAVTESAGGKKK